MNLFILLSPAGHPIRDSNFKRSLGGTKLLPLSWAEYTFPPWVVSTFSKELPGFPSGAEAAISPPWSLYYDVDDFPPEIILRIRKTIVPEVPILDRKTNRQRPCLVEDLAFLPATEDQLQLVEFILTEPVGHA